MDLPNKIKNEMIFKISPGKSPEKANLKSLEWAVLTQLNGKISVGEISNLLSLDQKEIETIFRKLIEEGLVQVADRTANENIVSQEQVASLSSLFTRYVGPVAKYIIEENLAEMDSTRENLLKEKFTFLIEMLSLEISDERKRVEFQKKATLELRTII
jgi:hypothetical protein